MSRRDESERSDFFREWFIFPASVALRMRARGQYVAVFLLFLTVQGVALLFAPILYDLSLQAFEDPGDPLNPLYYVAAMIVMTAIILVVLKLTKGNALRYIFLGAVFMTLYAVFLPLTFYMTDSALLVDVVPTLLALVLVLLLWKSPEWYVIDLVGLIVAFGAAAILGVSFGILPVFILHIVLAVYDAISVYKTKHMLTLAEGVSELRLPVLFVVPKSLDYRMDEEGPLDLKDESKAGTRETMMMGVGDAVIPGILVVSAAIFLSPEEIPFQYSIEALAVALGTLLGSFLGFAILMRQVATGRPQAGLPFLNGGAMAGFLIAYVLVYGALPFL
jgi:presenilin-like A22 family membrane protease